MFSLRIRSCCTVSELQSTHVSLSLYHACLSVCLSVCACLATASVTGTIRRRRNAFSSCRSVHKNSGTRKPSNTTFCFCRRCEQSSFQCCCVQWMAAVECSDFDRWPDGLSLMLSHFGLRMLTPYHGMVQAYVLEESSASPYVCSRLQSAL